MGEFECEANGAEFAKRNGLMGRGGKWFVWIYKCEGGWGGGGDLVVVENDDVDAALFEPGDGLNGRGAAIDGEQEGSREFVETIFDGFLAKAITFVHPVREIVIGGPTETRQDFQEQGSGSNAVDVIVAEDDERFFAFASEEKAVDGKGHVRQEKGVGEVFEARFEEIVNGLWVGEAAVEQALGEERGKAELICQLAGEQGLRQGEGPAELHKLSARLKESAEKKRKSSRRP
jgi:hypothetical protein